MEACRGQVKDVWGTPRAEAAGLSVDKSRWAVGRVLEFGCDGAPQFFARVALTAAGRHALKAGLVVVLCDARANVPDAKPDHGFCASTYDGTVAVLTPAGDKVEVRLDAETAIEFWASALVPV